MVEHMANPSAYIQSSRHQVYYFRIRVPLHLQNQLNIYINQGNGGTPISHTSAHESTAVAAPFQA